jgi:hypothetical protein
MGLTRRYNRVWIAALAIRTLVPLIRSRGCHHYATATSPSFWELRTNGLHLILGENVLPLPTFDSLRTTLDVYPDGGRKAMSLSWDPLEIVSFRGDEWIERVIELAIEGEDSGTS